MILDAVINEFMEMTKIPRPSHHEEKIAEYLRGWAVEHGLEVRQDELGSIIIDKPASPGHEADPIVMMQAHMDMVCVCEEGVEYNPLTDAIKVINDGKYLTADGTSLGADDGIGVAMALAVLKDEELVHGPLRAIITTNEEDGMDSMGMDPKYFEGQYLINLDWEQEGSLCNSCAGGDFFNYSRAAEWEAVPAGSKAVAIEMKDMLGGHSGVGINLGHANAIVTIGTCISMIEQEGIHVRVASFSGGQAKNAIPGAAKAVITFAETDLEKVKAIFEKFKAEFDEAFGDIEKEGTFTVTIADALPEKVLSVPVGKGLISLITTVPNNVHTMSPFIDGLVESSANLGELSVDEEAVKFSVFARSSVAYQATQIGIICGELAEMAGYDFDSEGHVPGWAVNPNSKLTPIACEAYKALTGKDMIVEPVHAGVECGAFAEKNGDLDMIAIGPTLIDVHTPGEKCELAAVESTTELLFEIIRRLAS